MSSGSLVASGLEKPLLALLLCKLRYSSTFNFQLYYRYFWEIGLVTSTQNLEHVISHFIPGEFDSAIVPTNKTMIG